MTNASSHDELFNNVASLDPMCTPGTPDEQMLFGMRADTRACNTLTEY